ncbi:MAG: MoaA/NifB/PqqE/SkfB family radical SAM enzyme [Bradymonadia bacterium]
MLAHEDKNGGKTWDRLREALETVGRFDGISDQTFVEVGPDEAIVRLGFRCNQRCDFCWQDRTWPEPPAEFYRTWVNELAAGGCDILTFSGGEPTIHKELFGLLELARSHGMRLRLQTNAVQMAKEGFAQRLADAGVELLFVSFHSHIPEVSDAMTRSPRTAVRTEAGIRKSLEAGIAVELNCVVEKRNYKQLTEQAEFIVEHFASVPGGRLIGMHYSHPCAAYEREIWAEHLIPLSAVQPNLVGAIQVLSQAGVHITAIGTCGFPPCIAKEAPEVLLALDRSQHNEGDISGRFFPEPCGRCAFRDHCLGVRREYFDTFGTDGIQPFETMPEFSLAERRTF